MARKQGMEDIRETFKDFDGIPKGVPRSQPKRKNKWLHDRDTLLYGAAKYKAKYLGMVEVGTCNDNETIQKVVRELKQKGTSKLQDVDISISVRSLNVTEIKSKMHICKFKLQKIAYCSDNCGERHKIFAFIAKKSETNFHCHCFETQNIAHTITLTLGQAFELAYERFQEAKMASESFVGQLKKVKASRLKNREDFGKKLAEQFQGFDEESEDHDIVPELRVSQPRMGRRSSKDIREQEWVNLRETLRLVCDDDVHIPQSNNIDDFNDAFEAIQNEIDEWSQARSPFQCGSEEVDALMELDSAIAEFGSDSQTMLPQVPPEESPEETSM